MGRMSERWAELQDDLELADCEFQHWQEWLAADPAYFEWASQLEHEQEQTDNGKYGRNELRPTGTIKLEISD